MSYRNPIVITKIPHNLRDACCECLSVGRSYCTFYKDNMLPQKGHNASALTLWFVNIDGF